MLLASQALIGAIIAVSAVAASAEVTSSEPARSAIWFTPLQPSDRLDGPGRMGASDYFEIFNSADEWPTVAANVSVFKIYDSLLRSASDDQLRHMAAFLASRHIALALELPVLVDTVVCKPGVDKSSWMIPLAGRLNNIGIRLDYLAMVGPLVDGHVEGSWHGCHRPIPEVAADAARTVTSLRAIYPGLIVGDIEPVGHKQPGYPDWNELSTWFAAFRQSAGVPIAFLQADITWDLPWHDDLEVIARMARAAGVKFGVIYNATGRELSNAGYAVSVAEHESEVEALTNMPPDQVNFQTWQPYPDRLLPESDPSTMTGVIHDYLREPVRLERVGSSKLRLTGRTGKSLAKAEVTLERPSAAGADGMVTRNLTGSVPPGAVSALFALRVHVECQCAAKPADVVLGPLEYAETNMTGYVPIRWEPRPWEEPISDINPGVVSHVASVNGAIRIKVPGDQKMIRNSPTFPVTAGAPFDVHFAWQVPSASDATGHVALIFLGANGQEVHRIAESFTTTMHEIARLQTDARGEITLSRSVTADAAHIVAVYPGDDVHKSVRLALDR